MTRRYHTLAEANARLADLSSLLAVLRGARATLLDAELAERLAGHAAGNGGGADAARHAQAAIDMARGLRLADEWGVILRDIDEGLCDFPALLDGREVYLCWVDGEERIAFWHEVHAGFAGREEIGDLFG